MIRKYAIVTNPSGLSVDPSATLSAHARAYECTSTIYYKHYVINAKSMLHIISAVLTCGSEIELVCDGPDEEACMKDLYELILHGLEQEESHP